MTSKRTKGGAMLGIWLERNRTSAHAFALSIQTDPGRIRRMIRGDSKRVDIMLARRVEQATNGDVPMQAWGEYLD